jgi:diaminopimelate epimerase
MIKFKADNIGCGDCRMKAVSNLVSQGAKKVSFDMAKSQILVDEGPLALEKVIELIEKASIFVEGVVSDVIRVHVAYQAVDQQELETLLKAHHPQFTHPGVIEFPQGADVYDIEDLLTIYGYNVSKVDQTH